MCDASPFLPSQAVLPLMPRSSIGYLLNLISGSWQLLGPEREEKNELIN